MRQSPNNTNTLLQRSNSYPAKDSNGKTKISIPFIQIRINFHNAKPLHARFRHTAGWQTCFFLFKHESPTAKFKFAVSPLAKAINSLLTDCYSQLRPRKTVLSAKKRCSSLRWQRWRFKLPFRTTSTCLLNFRGHLQLNIRGINTQCVTEIIDPAGNGCISFGLGQILFLIWIFFSLKLSNIRLGLYVDLNICWNYFI